MVSAALTARYRYDYARFADWCAVHGYRPIPADPSVIGEYLASAPAAPSTQRGRLSAINWAHRNAGFPAPGRSPHVRDLLNPVRASRTERLHELIEAVLPNLPTWGWPTGLFGRRDAVILHLARSGLSFPLIAGLDRSEVVIREDRIEIGAGPLLVLRAADDCPSCPVAAFRRWSAVLAVVHRPTATYLLEQHLENETLPERTSPRSTGPLLFALDRDGNPALNPSPLTPGSIGVITAAHILGRAPTHRPRQRRRGNGVDFVPDLTVGSRCPSLSNDHFDRGLAARRRALESMADIDALLDAAEAEVDRVLARWG